MITINKPIIVAQSYTPDFSSFSMVRENGRMYGTATFKLLDSEGNFVSVKTIKWENQDWNSFWSQFTSGEFLYKELQKSVGDTQVLPTEVESEFTN